MKKTLIFLLMFCVPVIKSMDNAKEGGGKKQKLVRGDKQEWEKIKILIERFDPSRPFRGLQDVGGLDIRQFLIEHEGLELDENGELLLDLQRVGKNPELSRLLKEMSDRMDPKRLDKSKRQVIVLSGKISGSHAYNMVLSEKRAQHKEDDCITPESNKNGDEK